MVSFTRLIETSFEWMVAVLLRPFNLKKWLILTFVALLAGTLGGRGFNFSLPHRGESRHKVEARNTAAAPNADTAAPESSPQQNDMRSFLKENSALFVPLVILFIALFIGLALLIYWLYARFSFVFLEDVITNDASIKKPFRENKREAGSLFRFLLLLSVIFGIIAAGIIGLCVFLLFRQGVLQDPKSFGWLAITLKVLPFILLLVLLGCAYGLTHLALIDFGLIIMYRDKIAAAKALGMTGVLIKTNPKEFFLYLLVKTGLGIATITAYMIVFAVLTLFLLVPLGAAGVGGYLLFQKMLPAQRTVLVILATVIAIPLLLAVSYAFNALMLPAAVFFRTLSVKFLGALIPHYDLFQPNHGQDKGTA